MASSKVNLVNVKGNPQEYEQQHVHAIYDQIADHFSSTRYKPWPIIADFLDRLPPGSVGLDSGTGNGKYLPLPNSKPIGSVWTIGLDRSQKLLLAAQKAGGITREVVWGNVLDHSWRSGVFDFAISIATIHHLASAERRLLAVKRLMQAVSPSHGRILIYVWAIEQDDLSKRTIPTVSQQGQGADVFVPWKMQAGSGHGEASGAEMYNRYYHMFSRGELENLVKQATEELGLKLGQGDEREADGMEVVQSGWEKSNYYIELKRWNNRMGRQKQKGQ